MGCCATDTAPIQNERLEGISKKDGAGGKDAKTMGAPRIETKKDDPIAARRKLYARNPPILLGYWKIRGLAQPLRYLLEYSEHPY